MLSTQLLVRNLITKLIAMENKVISAITGGLAGTAVITGVMLLGSQLGMPDIDFGTMISNFTGTTPFIGWVLHFVMGVALAFLYVYFFREFLPGTFAVKGMLFSVLPYVLTIIMLFPLLSMDMSSSKSQSPGVFLVSTMIAYLAFGLVMGFIAKPYGVKNTNPAF
ncbi:MAG: hypothetical protein JWQ96_1569 [Segetibacter sp.]|nr:hypothetical protein [Segetibacter sp.]